MRDVADRVGVQVGLELGFEPGQVVVGQSPSQRVEFIGRGDIGVHLGGQHRMVAFELRHLVDHPGRQSLGARGLPFGLVGEVGGQSALQRGTARKGEPPAADGLVDGGVDRLGMIEVAGSVVGGQDRARVVASGGGPRQCVLEPGDTAEQAIPASRRRGDRLAGGGDLGGDLGKAVSTPVRVGSCARAGSRSWPPATSSRWHRTR